MAKDPEAIVRAMFEAFNANDPDTALELFHDDIVWQPPLDEPDTAHSHGKDEVMGFLLQWFTAFDDFRTEPLEYICAEDRVVVPQRMTGRIRGSGSDVTISEAHVFWIREGKIAEAHGYRTKEEALAAAGISGA
jgi:ketosteroid isomerase-like protein